MFGSVFGQNRMQNRTRIFGSVRFSLFEIHNRGLFGSVFSVRFSVVSVFLINILKKKFYLISMEDYIKCRPHKRYFLSERRTLFISIRDSFLLLIFQCGMLRNHSQKIYLISIEVIHKMYAPRDIF